MKTSSLIKFSKKAYFYFLKLWLRIIDPRQIDELTGKRVVFSYLKKNGWLSHYKDKRILEIGPKYGTDSVLLAALKPQKLVLFDLPEKKSLVNKWLSKVAKMCNTKYIEANILYLDKKNMDALGRFDLIWCLGVLYHNVEQLRLLKKIYDLAAINGLVVIESATTRNTDLADINAVEIHWPKHYRGVQTITHLPSRLAIKSWLEMVGFVDVKILDVYSHKISWQRTVITARKIKNSNPYINYGTSGLNSLYAAGGAK